MVLHKKAGAPVSIVILVIGTFVICILIFLILISGLKSIKNSFVGPGVIESIYSLERDFHLDSNLDGLMQDPNAVVVLDLENGNVDVFDKTNIDFPDEYVLMSNNGKSFYGVAGFKDQFIMLGIIRVGKEKLPLVEISYNKLSP